MANIKDLKKRIKSTKASLKITTAMKLVAAAKLARAQEAITSSRPYADELDQTMKSMVALSENYTHRYLEQNSSPFNLLLVVSSDKGLCGGYNAQLVKSVKKFLKDKDLSKWAIYIIGKKGKELLKSYPIKKVYTSKGLQFSFDELKDISFEFGSLFSSGEFGEVHLAYNKFQSAISFESKVKKLLPMSLEKEEKNALKEKFPFDYKYDVSPEELLDGMVPKTLTTNLFVSYLDAIASEHGSRMSAMDSASKNCSELIRSLTLTMNKLRQAAITTELIEVVSGAETLNG